MKRQRLEDEWGANAPTLHFAATTNTVSSEGERLALIEQVLDINPFDEVDFYQVAKCKYLTWEFNMYAPPRHMGYKTFRRLLRLNPPISHRTWDLAVMANKRFIRESALLNALVDDATNTIKPKMMTAELSLRKNGIPKYLARFVAHVAQCPGGQAAAEDNRYIVAFARLLKIPYAYEDLKTALDRILNRINSFRDPRCFIQPNK